MLPDLAANRRARARLWLRLNRLSRQFKLAPVTKKHKSPVQLHEALCFGCKFLCGQLDCSEALLVALLVALTFVALLLGPN